MGYANQLGLPSLMSRVPKKTNWMKLKNLFRKERFGQSLPRLGRRRRSGWKGSLSVSLGGQATDFVLLMMNPYFGRNSRLRVMMGNAGLDASRFWCPEVHLAGLKNRVYIVGVGLHPDTLLPPD
jgi:hypothetical protein